MPDTDGDEVYIINKVCNDVLPTILLTKYKLTPMVQAQHNERKIQLRN